LSGGHGGTIAQRVDQVTPMENCTSGCKQNYILYIPQDQAPCESSKEDTLPLGSKVVGVELANQWSSCYLSNGAGKTIGAIIRL
jgi:hypothetical protein